jgi:hypothetical protein
MNIDDEVLTVAVLALALTATMLVIGYVLGMYSMGVDVCDYAGMAYGTVKDGQLWCLDKGVDHELMVRLT